VKQTALAALDNGNKQNLCKKQNNKKNKTSAKKTKNKQNL
jgi:hypothetical protein